MDRAFGSMAATAEPIQREYRARNKPRGLSPTMWVFAK